MHSNGFSPKDDGEGLKTITVLVIVPFNYSIMSPLKLGVPVNLDINTFDTNQLKGKDRISLCSILVNAEASVNHTWTMLFIIIIVF